MTNTENAKRKSNKKRENGDFAKEDKQENNKWKKWGRVWQSTRIVWIL